MTTNDYIDALLPILGKMQGRRKDKEQKAAIESLMVNLIKLKCDRRYSEEIKKLSLSATLSIFEEEHPDLEEELNNRIINQHG